MLLVQLAQLVLVLAVVRLSDTYSLRGAELDADPGYDNVHCRTLNISTKLAKHTLIDAYAMSRSDPAGDQPEDLLSLIRVRGDEDSARNLCMIYSKFVSSQAHVSITSRQSSWGEIPVIRLTQPTTYRVMEGQKVELTCSATGDPAPDIQWSGNSRWSGNSTFSGMNGVPGRVTGVFSAVSFGDAGIYTCTVENYAATIEQSVDLVVVSTSHATLPVFFQPKEKFLWAREGETVEMTCSANDDNIDAPIVNWSSHHKFRMMKGVPGRVTGTIPVVSFDDAGTYTCITENDAGITTVRQHLRVYSRSCLPANPGPPGSLRPLVPAGCPPWYYSSCRPAPPGGPSGCDSGGGAPRGPIRGAPAAPRGPIDDSGLRHFDGGQPDRDAVGPPSTASHDYKPPVISFDGSSVLWVLEGTDVELACVARWEPGLTVSWYNHAGLTEVPSAPGQARATLSDVTPDKAGLYRCYAENVAGTSLAWLKLRVFTTACLPGPPGPPGYAPPPLPASCPPSPPSPQPPQPPQSPCPPGPAAPPGGQGQIGCGPRAPPSPAAPSHYSNLV